METPFVLVVLFFASHATGGLVVNCIGLGHAMSRLSVSSYIEFHSIPGEPVRYQSITLRNSDRLTPES
jgi:hypothetical protein